MFSICGAVCSNSHFSCKLQGSKVKKLNVSGWPSPRARLFVVVANWPGTGFKGFSLVFELLDTGSFPLYLNCLIREFSLAFNGLIQGVSFAFFTQEIAR